MQGLTAFIKTLGAARIAAMGAVTVALIGFFAVLILRVTAPQMTPLFTDLTMQDSATIVKDLERQGIAYELKHDGATILVPKDQVLKARMKLAESGLPRGSGVGYEIFDKSDTLGATSFIQNINHLRALEGELARTIRALHRVEMARVHLVLPERPLFSRDKADPSASIVLKVRGTLEPQQVRAIRHLVATAVTGLKPQRVSVVDKGIRVTTSVHATLAADHRASDGHRGALFLAAINELLQQPDQLVMIFNEDHEVRHVRMNGAHPAQVTPSWHGDSIAHYEGDTLVSDTVGIKASRKFAMIDLFGTERAVQCWRDSMASLIDRPLLRKFLSGMLTVMGRSPTSVVRVVAIPAIFDRKLLRLQRAIDADLLVGGAAFQRVEAIAPPPQRIGCIK